MSYNLAPNPPGTRLEGESVDWVSALEAMAAVEMAFCAPYGLAASHGLWPELLTGTWPEAVRWITASRTTHQGQVSATQVLPNPLLAHPGGVFYDDYTLKLFVALGPRGAAAADLYGGAGWVPRAYQEAYNLNRTLDGQVRLVTLLSPGVPAQQSWGRTQGRPNWYTGWLFDVLLRLRYTTEAS